MRLLVLIVSLVLAAGAMAEDKKPKPKSTVKQLDKSSPMLMGGESGNPGDSATAADAKEKAVQDIFQPYGQIARIFVSKDKITGQCKGFGFITFETEEGAKLAVAAGRENRKLGNSIINVEFSKKKGKSCACFLSQHLYS